MSDTGGGIWDSVLSSDGSKLILACEDGSTRVYSTESASLALVRMLPKQPQGNSRK